MGAPQQELMAYGAAAGAAAAVEDYFAAYTYTGNGGGTATVTNNIDVSTKGGLVWIKRRDSAGWDNVLSDSINGGGTALYSNTTGALNGADASIVSFSTTGFVAGASVGAPFISWSFAQGSKFFKVAQVTVSGSNQTVDLSSLGTVGMVTVKRTDATSNWYTWHKDLSAGNLVYLNLTDAQASLGHITMSGTTLTLVQSVIGNGTYIVYAWAHDTSAGGMIQCGSFTDSASLSVTLGWEPQYILAKSSTQVGTPWAIFDISRYASNTNCAEIDANTSAAEAVVGTGIWVPTATGFNQTANWFGSADTLVYMAIRRGPMKTPTVGTQVYNAVARAGTSAAATITGVGFAPDLVVTKKRASGTATGATWEDRLRGATQVLVSSASTAESSQSTAVTSFNMDGIAIGSYTNINQGSGTTLIDWYFHRTPKVFDEVCYTGTGSARTVTHNLGVAPELMIIKSRSDGTQDWGVYYGTNTRYLVLDTTAAFGTAAGLWNNTSPSASVFTVGTDNMVNGNTNTYVAYLFATLAGISKIGTYTGDGTTGQTINCGFTTGARWIMIKRTDSTGDWFVWDTTRGINVGSDPNLKMNTTGVEITTYDEINSDNSGFIVVQNSTNANINVTSATYTFLALS